MRDGGLCHGAAGNVHIYNRLYQATGEGLYRDTALTYFDLLLSMRKEGQGVGGFQAYMPDASDASPWKDVPGLLEGAAGIGLALLSALHPVRPSWDRMLLVDVH